jgi:hypothetical protein
MNELFNNVFKAFSFSKYISRSSLWIFIYFIKKSSIFHSKVHTIVDSRPSNIASTSQSPKNQLSDPPCQDFDSENLNKNN